MTHVLMLPRDEVPAARTGCPWDETTVPWSPPSGASPDYTLPENSKVLINSDSNVGHVVVPATSELIFADANMELTAKSISILGKMRIGAATCRTTTKSIVTLTGTASDASASSSLHKGIVVSSTGSISMYGALSQPSWTRLANAAASGDTIVYLQECVEWQAGDTVLLTTTHAEDHRRHNKNEKATIASVECVSQQVDGLQHSFGKVTFTASISHGHYANRHEYQAEVALLTRKIVIRGDASSPPTDPQPPDIYCSDNTRTDIPCHNYYLTGHGGHFMVEGNGIAEISSVEFTRMGRTNHIGRYPVHLHMLGSGGKNSFVKDCAVHVRPLCSFPHALVCSAIPPHSQPRCVPSVLLM